ncbi:MAG: TetR/AcrR family transcriptional regulator [Polyangiaceae bacterium]
METRRKKPAFKGVKSVAPLIGRALDRARVRLGVDERRAQLLELGLSIFGSTNYDAISIDDIAERAGMSKGLLYHYFVSKRGFYVAVVRHAAAKLAEQFVFDPGLPPEARARRGLELYLDFVSDRAEAYTALMRSGVGSDPEVLEILESTRDVAVGVILHTIGVKEERPLLRLAFRSWVGAVEAAALSWLDRREIDKGTLVELLWRLLVQTGIEALRLDPVPGLNPNLLKNSS